MIYYKKKIQQDVGATAVEYGLLSALIAVVTILSLQATGTNLGTTYCTIANKLSQAVGAGATASGCSATPSPSSPNSSVNNSDGTGSDSHTPASVSSPNATNDYTLGSTPLTRVFTIQSLLALDYSGGTINGIYDADGNALTTSEDIASYLGIQKSLYDAFNNANNGLLKGTATSEDVYNTETALDNAIAGTTKQIYIPDPKAVSTSGTPNAVHYLSQEAQTVTGDGSTEYMYGYTMYGNITKTTSALYLAPPSGK